MNLADLQREAHTIAKDHGWWDEERMMARFLELGMKGHAYGGVTDSQGNEVDCPDEATVFRLLGWPWIPPEQR